MTMTKTARPALMQEHWLLRKLFPLVDTNDICFQLIYGAVALTIGALCIAGLVTGERTYWLSALSLTIGAWVGQISPFFPAGVASVSMIVRVVLLVIFERQL